MSSSGGEAGKEPASASLESPLGAESRGSHTVRGSKAEKHSMLRAFAHRDYRLFFSGQLVSLIGTWMQSVAQSWLVYRLSGSAVLLGLVGFAGQIPVFLLAPAGGSLADTRSRHKIILGTQTAAMVLALVLAGLTLTGRVQLWHVFTLAALLGVVNAFDIPARQAFLVELVGRADLMNAIALNSSMFNGARIIGPALAGVLVAAIGEGWCFFLNGISYIAVLAGLLLMSPRPIPPRANGGTPLGRIIQGLRYSARTEPIRALLLLLGLMSLAGMPYAVLMPIFRRPDSAHRRPGTRRVNGSIWIRRPAGALVLASRRELRGLGTVDCMGGRGVWSQPDRLFGLAVVLAVNGTTRTGRLCDDRSDGRVEYLDPGDGSRRAEGPGDGDLFHDVHGYGPLRCFACRPACRSAGSARGGRGRWGGVHRGCRRVRIEAAGAPRRRQATADQPGDGSRRTHGRAAPCRGDPSLQPLKPVCMF